MKMDLQWFVDTTYTVTCYSDDGFSAFSASPASGAKGTTVTLTVTPATGHELDGIEVIAGGVTVEEEAGVYSFEIDEANVVLNAKSKSDGAYIVTENVYVCVNGTVTELVKNTKVKYGRTGAIIGVDCEGTEIAAGPAVQALIDSGVLVKI